MTHTVIWNGARKGPGGAHLFVSEQETVREAPVIRPHLRRGKTDAVRQLRTVLPEWFSIADVLQQLDVTFKEAKYIVLKMVDRGELEKQRKRVMVREQRYRFVGN